MWAEIKSTLKSNAENTDLKFQLQEEKIKVANNRISDLENSNTWLWRAIAGALISTVIAFLINFK
ncbi:MAG: hemolysin XhlA family protein [Clostridium celatum]|nr:hemolysin XhlA family protein [Clostridium celatum]